MTYYSFDLSDVEPPIDSLDSALDVAVDVLRDHDDPHGRTRVERLSRFVAYILGGEPYGPSESLGLGGTMANYVFDLAEATRRIAPDREHVEAGSMSIWRLGDLIGIELPEGDDLVRFDVTLARQVAVALLRCAEAVERDGRVTQEL